MLEITNYLEWAASGGFMRFVGSVILILAISQTAWGLATGLASLVRHGIVKD
jgi:hypothetical protein